MLTCAKSNITAKAFYAKRGFMNAQHSPGDEDPEEYYILFKDLRGNENRYLN